MIATSKPVSKFSVLLVIAGNAMFSTAAAGQDLANYFGFEGLEVLKIGRGAGPFAVADINDDGLTDIIAANNSMSRIEVHYQKRDASPNDVDSASVDVNEFPEHWRYRRQNISVTHQVNGVVAHDFDSDGMTDLMYGGSPEAIVFLRQVTRGEFEISRRHRVRNLQAQRNAFAVADVIGDADAELLSIVSGELHIWPLDADALGEPMVLATGQDLVAFMLEDYNGDGLTDIAGVIPEDAAPVRLWLATQDREEKSVNAQLRFEMPPLRELDSVRIPNESAARLAAIERVSKRIAIYGVTTTMIKQYGDRDAALRAYSFTNAKSRKRDHVVFDLDADGLLDLIATDTVANALAVYRQVPGKGLLAPELHPTLTDVDYCVAGNVDDDPYAEIFVLSEEEGVVGRSDFGPDGEIPFPRPLTLSDGYTPVAMNLVDLDVGPRVAVIAKSGRKHVIDLIAPDGHRDTIDLGTLSRAPETILALDADQDGRTDLLLFTRDKPMTMLYAGATGFELTESEAMGQFGLVKAATAENAEAYDIDGDGLSELLIADNNYVRALRYDPIPGDGISPGWQVVDQINAADASSDVVSTALLPDRIIAADSENNRLVIIARNASSDWEELESVDVRGFTFNALHAGAFSGDGEPNVLAIGDSGFAVVRLAGERVDLKELDSWRTSEERRLQHELASGDVNGDGFQDMISLDAGEQMCEIFTFSQTGRMLYATGFQVFETKIFSGGSSREFQPSQVAVADVTGDGAHDIILLAHDRVLIYPQMKSTD